MFDGCTELTTLNLSGWDVSEVDYMLSMFYNCSALTSLDLSGWNVSEIADMDFMFQGCSRLVSLDLSGWNVTESTATNDVLTECNSLRTIKVTPNNGKLSALIENSVGISPTVVDPSRPTDPKPDNPEPDNPNSGIDKPGNSHNTPSETAPNTPIPVNPSDIAVGDADFAPGGLARPPITIVVGGITLREGVDYTVSYSGAGGLGAATVTITGKGAYRFSVTKTFQVRPKAPTIKKLSLTKKGFAVKWGKLAASQTDGYQVRYATKKSMKGAKKATVKGAKRSSLKVSKLKAGKKYYVQMRTYKKVGKKTYYSAWSAAKAVKTKK